MAFFNRLFGFASRRFASVRAAVADRGNALSHKVTFRTDLVHVVGLEQTSLDLIHEAGFGTDLTHEAVIERRD